MTPAFRHAESYVSPTERAYERWAAKAEHLVGRSLLMDEDALHHFEAGQSPEEFARADRGDA